ncbi:MAG: LCP family protein [Clostridia bacterium]|nr:LCP family protein [Clostridia bacterium]
MQKIPRFIAICAALLCAVSLCLPSPGLANDRPGLKHYLVLGMDYYTVRESVSARSDVVLLVSLDPGGNRIIFTSILRDCKVTTPGGGENKLNTVHANYGIAGVKSTVERHLQLEIEGVVMMDFDAIKALIDALGGVELEISLAEYRWIYSILRGDDPNMPTGPGLTHMSGRIALAYMRDRHAGGSDFTRTANQRKVLAELMKKVSALSLPEMLHVYNTVGGMVSTDMDMMQMAAAFQMTYGLRNAQFVEHRVPADRTFAYGRLRGSSVLNVQWRRNRDLLQELFYPPAEGAAPR